MSKDDELDSVSDEELTISEVRIPEWKSKIPQEILKGTTLNPSQVDMLLALELIGQKVDFLIEMKMEENRHMRALERQVIINTRWRRRVTGKVAMLVAAGTISLTIFGEKIVGWIWPNKAAITYPTKTP